MNDFQKQLVNVGDDHLQRDYLNKLEHTEAIAQVLPDLPPEAALRIVTLALDLDLRLGSKLAGCVAPELQAQAVQLILGLDLSKVLTIALLKKVRSPAILPALIPVLEQEPIYYQDFIAQHRQEPGEFREDYQALVWQRHQANALEAIARVNHPEATKLLQKILFEAPEQPE